MTEEKEHKRHSCDTAVNLRMVWDGEVKRFQCWGCNELKINVCEETGEVIKYTLGGPIGEKCPKPKVEECDR